MSSASVLVLTSVHLHPPARRAATTNSTPTARTPTTPRAAYCACIRGIQRPPPAVRPPNPLPFRTTDPELPPPTLPLLLLLLPPPRRVPELAYGPRTVERGPQHRRGTRVPHGLAHSWM